MVNVNVNVYVYVFVACMCDAYTYNLFEGKICTHTCVHICYAVVSLAQTPHSHTNAHTHVHILSFCLYPLSRLSSVFHPISLACACVHACMRARTCASSLFFIFFPSHLLARAHARVLPLFFSYFSFLFTPTSSRSLVQSLSLILFLPFALSFSHPPSRSPTLIFLPPLSLSRLLFLSLARSPSVYPFPPLLTLRSPVTNNQQSHEPKHVLTYHHHGEVEVVQLSLILSLSLPFAHPFSFSFSLSPSRTRKCTEKNFSQHPNDYIIRKLS